MSTVVFYISGHGFGHASRDIEVVNALLAAAPDVSVAIRTSAARWLFDLTVQGPFQYDTVRADTGIVQHGSLALDAAASVAEARAFMATFDGRVAEEARALRALGATLVVADIPALGIAAAAAAGVPAVALGNFSWDWAYSAYEGSADVVEAIGRAYEKALLALRLPMCGGFERFPRVEDVPFIARISSRDPAETRAALGVPDGARAVLASFGGHGVTSGVDLGAIARLEGYVTLLSSSVPFGTGALDEGSAGNLVIFDEPALYARGFRYEDLVRAVDVVVTKPGYGIIAECLANDTALLYTSRGDFLEYEVLVQAMPAFLRAAFIDQPAFFAGAWGPALDALLAQPAPPTRPRTDGAAVVAARLGGMM
ncbi:MAG: hypothetical protein AB7O67_01770 [Vicinamibacterales bacterium]